MIVAAQDSQRRRCKFRSNHKFPDVLESINVRIWQVRIKSVFLLLDFLGEKETEA